MLDVMRSYLSCWAVSLLLVSICCGQDTTAETDEVGADLAGEVANDVAIKEEPPFVRLVQVPLPIQGTVDTQVRRSIEQILSNVPKSTERPIIVLEFAPPANGTGESSEFGRALDLSRFLASQATSQARMVAYIPKTVRGHAVLVALACEEIIMHPDAQIGDAGVDEANIDETLRRGYSEIADRRRTIPSAVAVGLLDREVQVRRLTTAQGTRFALDEEVAEIQSETTVQKIDTIIPAGEVGLLSGDKLRLDYGFVSHLAQDRKELASALNVPPSDLEIDPLLGDDWKAIQIELHGAINTVTVDHVMRRLEDRLGGNDDVNFVCISIDSPGGSVEDSLRLANYLSGIESAKTRTVAYVPSEALADAAIIAIACDQLAVHEDATIGGSGARELSRDDVDTAKITIQEIMNGRDRAWSLPVAMLDDSLEINEYQLAETNITDYFCEEELQEQNDPDRWERQEELSASGEVLQLTGEEAGEIGLARHVVSDFNEFQQRYQLEEAPEVLKPNWAQDLIVALATPQVAAGLLFIGFFALIVEASAPGIGVGGFVSAVCFLLFFWSNFLNGTAGWLEALLFIGGLIFISMEILVLPGFGIFGLGGGIMVLASLVLASQTFVIPQNEYQLRQLPSSLLIVAAALGGVGISAFFLQKYLAKLPFLNRMMLAPAEGEAAEELEHREAVVHFEHLLGKQGRTTTPLALSGKADFDGDLYDVVSDGLPVEKSATVEVVEVVGNRIIVRQAT